MDITWYGHSCFRITERGQTSVVTDPYSRKIGLPELKLKADIVTVSHDSPGHNAIDTVRDYQYILSGPGEYEIGGVFVTGIAMHDLDEDNENYRPNVAYLIEHPNKIRVLHLGDLNHIPDQSTIEAIGEVNVLLIPVGDGNGLKATLAAEVIALIEPNYVIPMHYAIPKLKVKLEPVDHFLRAMGISSVQEEEFLRVSASSLPEQPQVVILQPQI